MTQQVIHIHPDAPLKPAAGAPCNGCGVCCLTEPCPVGIFASRRLRGACAAVRWNESASRYDCSLALHPRWGALVRRFIASGQGCDCDLDVTAEPINRLPTDRPAG